MSRLLHLLQRIRHLFVAQASKYKVRGSLDTAVARVSIQKLVQQQVNPLEHLESLLVVHLLLLAFGRDLEALLGRVKDHLDLLDQAVLVLLELRVLFNSLLHKQFYVAQLGKVKVPLALQTSDSLLERVVLCLQGCGCRTTANLANTQARASRGRGTAHTTCSGATGSNTRSGSSTRATSHGGTLAATDGVVVSSRVVLVPESLCPLQELEVVLHLALYESLDGNGLVDLVLGESVCCALLNG